MRALATDLYELTMMAGYYWTGNTGRATFDLFVRSLPSGRGFLIAGGIQQALQYLARVRFEPEEIEYLRALPNFERVGDDFFQRLRRFRFTGDAWAVEEGTPVFAQEPIMRVTAPLPEAQLVETALLATVMFQTNIATKAARIVAAAQGRAVIEFGGRRAHGLDAAMHAARAAFLGGCDGTSNVEAGFHFGIPVSGTMAHSWVMAFPDEMEAFQRFYELYGRHAVLLIDTYDTVEAARQIVASGLRPAAVRLDSGDLVTLSREVRKILDEGGLTDTKIFASGDLDEYRIAELLAAGALVDGFGVGTALSTSSEAPALGGVYKLAEVEHAGRMQPVMKLSAGKHTYPGAKQIWRRFAGGTAVADVVGLQDEEPPADAVPLLEPAMKGGEVLGVTLPLTRQRRRCLEATASLPPAVRRLTDPENYPVAISEKLRGLTDRLAQQLTTDY